MTALRSFLFNVFFFGSLIIFLIAMSILLIFPWRVMESAVRGWSTFAIWGLKILVGLKWQVTGLEKMPEGPCIIAMKHQSAWDTVAPFLIFPRAAWVMKKELGEIPLWGSYARKCGAIFVDREAGASALKKLTADAQDRMNDGRSLIIFPEGTRKAPGSPPQYSPGVAALYKTSNVPVVPVALNSGVFWGRESFTKEPGLITLEILDPIAPGMDRRVFMQTLQERIESATDRLVADTGSLSIPK